jgi:hypothetical protein
MASVINALRGEALEWFVHQVKKLHNTKVKSRQIGFAIVCHKFCKNETAKHKKKLKSFQRYPLMNWSTMIFYFKFYFATCLNRKTGSIVSVGLG